MKPIRIVWTLTFAVVLLALPGLAGAQGSAAVSGTLTYRDRMALPANAVVTVQIARVVPDRPAEVIAEQRFTANGAQPPLPFSVSYDPARIDQRDSYIIQANISVNGQIRYGTTTLVPVITRGAPTQNVAVTLTARSLPNTSGGAWPLALAGVALLAALAVFAVRRSRTGQPRTI